MNLKNKFAIGCLVQFYEIEIIEDYLKSVKNSLDIVQNKDNVIIDICFNMNQGLEKVDENKISMGELRDRFRDILKDVFGYQHQFMDCGENNYDLRLTEHSESIYTIADYRREFNDKYCTEVDVLMWGESDSLIPTQTWYILDELHNSVREKTPKYVSFFATCKMWDDTWKILEHPDFTDKPFIEMDTENWWSLRYNMNQQEMDEINNRTEELDIKQTTQLKFNGCGLVISSDVIKSGANIPKSVFFVHEDTAFMNNCLIHFRNQLPQYIIKNILLVHNRKLPNKRMYIEGQDIQDGDMTEMRKKQYWFANADKMSQMNAFNTTEQGHTFTWEDVFREYEN
tara:strand:- start:2258 stop:3280 length:1023 start_codon:yes stop_codon:yes gene_type:complete